ncbi:dual specificity protein kinase Ttk-like isoform X2 [Lingula anatina]|uniref:Dual specificity protein kinase Ttk-like isoform X2 n=1 Tax=Lingula anatina TaxID=7574 RepID=A0A2R2MJ76_LINAN|nr:dual specificity protein kinase Ttk-like isoform X2 [Lingula anatina]|eukprot:XP_023930258.1 dual specificity protein kinase Ttk-like isoform X2 [Lingula anatina]
MSSLQALKSRLQKVEEIKKENTQEVTDHSTWIKKIDDLGNKPDDWLQYTRFVKGQVQFTDEERRHSYLSSVYEKAMKAIAFDSNKKNTSYAQLLIDYANLKAEYDTDEAEAMFNHARYNLKGISIVHIAAAQFHLNQGNPQKCKKIIEKAKDVGAQPTELLNIAFKNFTYDKRVLLSEQDIEEALDPKSRQDKENQKPVELLPARKSWLSSSDVQKPKGHQLPARHASGGGQTPVTSASTESQSQQQRDVVASGSASRQQRPSSMGQVSSGTVADPATPEERERITTKPPSGNNRKLGGQPSSSTPDAPHPPGELSMADCMLTLNPLVMVDNTVSFRKPGSIRTRNCSSNSSEDSDTIPMIFETSKTTTRPQHNSTANAAPHSVTKPSLRSSTSVTSATLSAIKPSLRAYNSTPDCKSAGPTSFGSSVRRRPEFGLPMRVKRTSLPQLKEARKGLDEDDEEEEEDNGDIDSSLTGIKPLNLQHMNGSMSKGQDTADSGVFEQCSTEPMEVNHMEHNSTEPMEIDSPVAKKPLRSSVEMQKNNTLSCASKTGPKKNDSQANRLPQNSNPHGYLEPRSARKAQPQSCIQDQLPIQTVPASFPVVQTPSQHGVGYVMSTPSAYSHQFLPQQQQLYSNPSSYPHQPGAGLAACTPVVKPSDILTVNGQVYSILKVVGRGGSSKVYKVINNNKDILAVKSVNLEGADDMTLEGYKNEITLLKRLQYSDKVIKMFDFEYNKAENLLYVVMECGDTDLATLLRTRSKQGGITTALRKFYWEEMLQAVKVLHQEDIIHSDLKPANFLLVEGNLKLIDFGIANAIQQDKTSVIRESQIGTLNFMSPEAILDTCGGKQVDENGKIKQRIKIGVKSDVWSLGCILYNMTYSRTPFQHVTNQFAKLQAIVNPKVEIQFPEVEDALLMDVLKKCLIRDPKDRPSIEDLLAHPYLRKVEENTVPSSCSHTEESLQRVILQLSQANVNSPRSLSAISKGLLAQLQSGKELDVSSLVKKKAPPPVCPPELHPGSR